MRAMLIVTNRYFKLSENQALFINYMLIFIVDQFLSSKKLLPIP